ncbi:glycosyltransferase family 8 protein, partial [Lactobacillus parabuchneri]|nr:glycosyltransferase family 8 protein [Lentilactobacillus parabuchneri]
MSNQTVPAFFAVDDNYAAYLAVALESLEANASTTRDYDIIILCDDLNQENRDQLKKFARDNVQISF